MITSVVLTKNEEKIIGQCLKSLSWADEIIVLDDFSTDVTIGKISELKEIEDKVNIYKREVNGDFAGQRNFALSKARGEWVLFVDADEVVSKELVREILAKAKGLTQGYYLRRQDFFLGKRLKFGETGSLRLLRLAKKGSGQWKRPVHEYWDVRGKLGVLDNPLLHDSHRDIAGFVTKINQWSEIDAQVLENEGKPFSPYRALLNPIGKFLQNYILRFGFLDGLPGFVMAYMMSLYSLVVRVKQYDSSKTA